MPYPEGSVGAVDDRDCLNAVDRWLTGGIDHSLDEVLKQQSWGDEVRVSLAANWKSLTNGREPGEGLFPRGKGWRVWYPNGLVCDSKTFTWLDVPDGIVLGVSYNGPCRWMVQGRDPFWEYDGLLYDSRTFWQYFQASMGPSKMGVFVTDEDMQRFRLAATLAFVL